MFLDYLRRLIKPKVNRSGRGQSVAGNGFCLALVLVAQPLTGLAAQDTYSALKALYDQRQYQATVANGANWLSRASKSDPDYRRMQNLTVAAASHCQPLLKVSAMARDTYRDHPDSAVAAANFGALQITVGDRELAGQLFQKAIEIDPGDFLARVGLAEVLSLDPKHGATDAVAELQKAESARPNKGISEQQKWSVIGNVYITLNRPDQALSAFLKAKKAGSENPLVNKMLDQNIYRAALTSGQTETARKLMDEVLADPTVSGETITLTILKLCPPGSNGDSLAQKLYELGMRQAAANSYWSYSIGRAFDSVGRDRLASLCLESAVKYNAGDAKMVVADAAALSRCNQNVLARRRLLELSHRINLEEPRPESSMMQGLARLGLAMLSDYESNWASSVKESLNRKSLSVYKTAYADVKNLRCHCHLAGMQHTMRAVPGVIFADISDDRSPQAMIIYDSKKVSPGAVWSSVTKEGTLITLARSETPRDFGHMVQLALDFAEARYQPEHPYFSFEPLPLTIDE